MIALVVIAGAAIAWWQQRGATARGIAGGDPVASVADTTLRAPSGPRLRVRVLNGTSSRGLARNATMVLRDFGYDVVDFGSDAAPRDSTLVEVHTGRDEAGARITRLLGVGRVVTAPESLRYLDVTVRVGRDWQPPTQPLRP